MADLPDFDALFSDVDLVIKEPAFKRGRYEQMETDLQNMTTEQAEFVQFVSDHYVAYIPYDQYVIRYRKKKRKKVKNPAPLEMVEENAYLTLMCERCAEDM